jgi:predicted dinucleotide-binding enzyme
MELIQHHIQGASVAKAFNTILWQHLRDRGRPAGDPGRLAIPLAGDDDEAKRAVAGLIDQSGFDPVDTGKLADAGADRSRARRPSVPPGRRTSCAVMCMVEPATLPQRRED